MSTDQDFYVLRQFSESSIRVALYMQYQIATLEDELRKEDELCMAQRMDNGSLHFDQSIRRIELLPQLTECIRNYRKSKIYYFKQTFFLTWSRSIYHKSEIVAASWFCNKLSNPECQDMARQLPRCDPQGRGRFR